jgi:hypothetical protein
MRRFVNKQEMISGMRAACLRKASGLRPEDAVEQYLKVYEDALGAV